MINRYQQAEDDFLHHKKVVYSYPGIKNSAGFSKDSNGKKINIHYGSVPYGSYQGQKNDEDSYKSWERSSSSQVGVQPPMKDFPRKGSQQPSSPSSSSDDERDGDSTDYENYFSDNQDKGSNAGSDDQIEEGDSNQDEDEVQENNHHVEKEQKSYSKPDAHQKSTKHPTADKVKDENEDEDEDEDKDKGSKEKVKSDDQQEHDDKAPKHDQTQEKKLSDEDADKIVTKIVDKISSSVKQNVDESPKKQTSIEADVSASLKNSIKELANVIKTLSDKLSHMSWNTKVTVPVVVNVSVPHYKKVGEESQPPTDHEKKIWSKQVSSVVEGSPDPPIFLPAGGLFIDSVGINISSADNNSKVWFRVQNLNKEETEEEEKENNFSLFSSSIFLGPGNFTVQAYVEEEGFKNSSVASETFRVVDCGEDQCCSWRVERERLVLYLAQVPSKLFPALLMPQTLLDPLSSSSSLPPTLRSSSPFVSFPSEMSWFSQMEQRKQKLQYSLVRARNDVER